MFTIREYQARMEEIKLYLYEEFPWIWSYIGVN